MRNPHTRPQSGSYKNPLVEGLKLIGRETESNEFNNGNMKLAICSSITGNVTLYPDLKPKCIEALKSLEQTETTKYYIYGLENDDFAVASTNGAYTYDPTNESQTSYVKNRLEVEGNEIIQPYFS